MKNVLKTTCTVAVILTILLLAINGLLNFLYSGSDKEVFNKHKTSRKVIEPFRKDYKDAPKIKIPGIAALAIKGEYGTFSMREDGIRKSSKPSENATIRIAIFGASQAFGFLLPDEETLVSMLNQQSTRFSFVNYSVPGQSMSSTAEYVRYQFREAPNYDLAIMLSNPRLDIHYFCKELGGGIKPNKTLAFLRLFDNLQLKVAGNRDKVADTDTKYCEGTPYPERILIPEIQLSLENTREQIEIQGLGFYVFLLPSPYRGKPDISNIRSLSNAHAGTARIQNIESKLYENLFMLPNLIDLSNAFNGHGPMFNDAGGHFTVEGNKIVVRKILHKLDQHLSTQRELSLK